MKTLKLGSFFAVLGLSIATASSQVTSTAGVLRITTPNTDESFSIRVGPTAGNVQLFGVPGIMDGAPFTGIASIVVNTQGGLDKVQVQVESTVLPNLTINTGTGDSEVDIDLKVPPLAGGVTSRIAVTGGINNDKVLLEYDGDAQTANLIWDVHAGDGLNETLSVVHSDNRTTAMMLDLTVNGGRDLDNVNTLVGVQASNLRLLVDGNLGDGSDNYLLTGLGATVTNATLQTAINMGLGMDKAGIEVLQVRQVAFTGSVDMGAGDDVLEAKLYGNLLGTGVFNGGDGDDLIKAIVLGGIPGRPRIQGGRGNDLVEFLAQNAVTGSPLSDGGPGFDQFIGVGRFINFEL